MKHIRGGPSIEPACGLNRTSVGLKRSPRSSERPQPSGLNRTSVGLKPILHRGFCLERRKPQSNQRGIETRPGSVRSSARSPRLNRTSVGLKRLHGRKFVVVNTSLNRTSVGLKRISPFQIAPNPICLNQTSVGLKPLPGNDPGLPGSRLNRTSVGLKLLYHLRPFSSSITPQSNQRGIETPKSRSIDRHTRYASIEPAWD